MNRNVHWLFLFVRFAVFILVRCVLPRVGVIVTTTNDNDKPQRELLPRQGVVIQISPAKNVEQRSEGPKVRRSEVRPPLKYVLQSKKPFSSLILIIVPARSTPIPNFDITTAGIVIQFEYS